MYLCGMRVNKLIKLLPELLEGLTTEANIQGRSVNNYIELLLLRRNGQPINTNEVDKSSISPPKISLPKETIKEEIKQPKIKEKPNMDELKAIAAGEIKEMTGTLEDYNKGKRTRADIKAEYMRKLLSK